MKVDLEDYAMRIPLPKREHWSFFHWFWAKLFGERVPTSGERAHIGNLIIKAEPGFNILDFGDSIGTDAQRVYQIGDLLIFDYGDTPLLVYEAPYKMLPKTLDDSNTELLKENIKRYTIREELT